MKLPVVLFVFGAVIIPVQVLQGIVDVGAVDGEGDALSRIGSGGFGKIDDHGFVSGDDHRFAGKVFEGWLIGEVHDLFARTMLVMTKSSKVRGTL